MFGGQPAVPSGWLIAMNSTGVGRCGSYEAPVQPPLRAAAGAHRGRVESGWAHLARCRRVRGVFGGMLTGVDLSVRVENDRTTPHRRAQERQVVNADGQVGYWPQAVRRWCGDRASLGRTPPPAPRTDGKRHRRRPPPSEGRAVLLSSVPPM